MPEAPILHEDDRTLGERLYETVAVVAPAGAVGSMFWQAAYEGLTKGAGWTFTPVDPFWQRAIASVTTGAASTLGAMFVMNSVKALRREPSTSVWDSVKKNWPTTVVFSTATFVTDSLWQGLYNQGVQAILDATGAQDLLWARILTELFLYGACSTVVFHGVSHFVEWLLTEKSYSPSMATSAASGGGSFGFAEVAHIVRLIPPTDPIYQALISISLSGAVPWVGASLFGAAVETRSIMAAAYEKYQENRQLWRESPGEARYDAERGESSDEESELLTGNRPSRQGCCS